LKLAARKSLHSMADVELGTVWIRKS